MRVAKNRAWGSAQRFLEGRRRHGLERQRKAVAVGTEALESPGELRLRGDALGAAGGNDAEEDAGAVCALGAAGEEHVEAELGDILKLPLGGRVVDGDHGVVDESEERVAAVLVVVGGENPTSPAES